MREMTVTKNEFPRRSENGMCRAKVFWWKRIRVKIIIENESNGMERSGAMGRRNVCVCIDGNNNRKMCCSSGPKNRKQTFFIIEWILPSKRNLNWNKRTFIQTNPKWFNHDIHLSVCSRQLTQNRMRDWGKANSMYTSIWRKQESRVSKFSQY